MLVLFLHKVAVPDDPFKEVQLVQLNEADVFRVLAETLGTHIETRFWIRLCQFEQTWQEQEPWPNCLRWLR